MKAAVRGVWCVALMAALAMPLAAQEDDMGLPLGTAAPVVEIKDLDGNPASFAPVIGKKAVLIEFWATWCSLCAALAPRIDAAYAERPGDLEVIIVAVGVNQTIRSVKRHFEKHPQPYARVLWDDAGKATRAYMAPSTSYLVAVNAAGTIVYTGLGSDQNVKEAMKRATAR